jgi:hypothetical protein
MDTRPVEKAEIIGVQFNSLGRRTWILKGDPRANREPVTRLLMAMPSIRRLEAFRSGALARCQGLPRRPHWNRDELGAYHYAVGWDAADLKIWDLS